MTDTDETTVQTNEAEQAVQGESTVEVQEVDLQKVAGEQATGQSAQIDVLMETSMPVSAQLGQVEMEVREILQLGPGSVLKLDKQVGEPVDLYLRGVRFAVGDLVVIGEQLGVRIRRVLTSDAAGK